MKEGPKDFKDEGRLLGISAMASWSLILYNDWFEKDVAGIPTAGMDVTHWLLILQSLKVMT